MAAAAVADGTHRSKHGPGGSAVQAQTPARLGVLGTCDGSAGAGVGVYGGTWLVLPYVWTDARELGQAGASKVDRCEKDEAEVRPEAPDVRANTP